MKCVDLILKTRQREQWMFEEKKKKSHMKRHKFSLSLSLCKSEDNETLESEYKRE